MGDLAAFFQVPLQPATDMNPIILTTSDTSEFIIYVLPNVRNCAKTVLQNQRKIISLLLIHQIGQFSQQLML